ncbi:nucleotide exchange factor GrpE [Patulibacter defluvii]|uniref:nucleotide exchange factor GrpE n=1 Tax=Patulibacter defluvii TaxID=3095358 RepID=UPI002A7511B5|nr:nucleotide exchange factor GrpE [Patulibacter sp. DM4]
MSEQPQTAGDAPSPVDPAADAEGLATEAATPETGTPVDPQSAAGETAAAADEARAGGSAEAGADGAPAAEAEAEPAAEVEEPDWKDKYVRAVAELDNVRKRARRDAAAGELRGVSRLARELLPALDNLDRALAHLSEAPEAGDQQIVDGLRIVHRELHGALAQAGIESYDPTGEEFDPRFHEALSQQPAPEGTLPGTVVTVYQAGYRLRDDVLRPAKVIVAG